MTKRWQTLFADMLADVDRCQGMSMPEMEQVEWTWKIARNYWSRLKTLYRFCWFENSDEEIDFYKNIKPAFTSYIKYFTRVYTVLGELRPDTGYCFWEREAKRLQEFTGSNGAFVEYYKNGCTCYDQQYFMTHNSDPYMVPEPYDVDKDFISSHDHLVASLLAEEMYHVYVNKKVNKKILYFE